jgi:nitrogenase iron protein NifH
MSLFQTGDCAGSGISEVFSYFRRTKPFDSYQPDFVLYDLPMQVLCGAFTHPSRQIGFEQAYVVTTQDFPALFTTNSIFRILAGKASSAGTRLGGIIANGLTSPFSETIIRDFAKRTGVQAVSCLPNSTVVIQSELYGMSVMEAAPRSNHSYIYRRLANRVVENRHCSIPSPMETDDIRAWAREWGDRIYELETGLIYGGAAI